MKAEVDKIDIKILVNVQKSKSRCRWFGCWKVENCGFEKKSDAVGNEILENTKLNKLNTKVNNQIN